MKATKMTGAAGTGNNYLTTSAPGANKMPFPAAPMPQMMKGDRDPEPAAGKGNNYMLTLPAGADREPGMNRPMPGGGKSMTNMPGMAGGRAGMGGNVSSNPLSGMMAGADRANFGAKPVMGSMMSHTGSFAGMKFPGRK